MAEDRTTAYARWLVQNKDKQNTPEYNTVASAYKKLRASPAPAPEAQADGQLRNPYNLAEANTGTDGAPELAGMARQTGNVLNIAQGATANFADELAPNVAAGLQQVRRAIVPGSDDSVTFDQDREYYSGLAKHIGQRMWNERPIQTFAAQAAGSVGPGVLAAKAATRGIGLVAPTTARYLTGGVANVGERAVHGALTGAIAGSAAGVGGGETPLERGAGFVTGGLLGAGIGAALPVLGAPASNAARWIQSTFAPGTVNAEQRAAQILARSAERAGLRSSVPGGPPASPQFETLPNSVLADSSDEMTNLAGAVYRAPGQGSREVGDFLRARQEFDVAAPGNTGQLGAMLDELTAISPVRSAKRAAEQMRTTRANAADPLYQEFRDYGFLQTDDLTTLATNRDVVRGLEEGLQTAKNLRQVPPNYSIRAGVDAATGDPIPPEIPAAVWHGAKESVDQQIAKAMADGHLHKVNGLISLKNQIMGALDDATDGAYGRAANQYAGDSAVLNAITLGKTILQPKTTAEDLADMLARFTTASEHDAFRAGAVQSLRSELTANVGPSANAAAKVLNRAGTSEKIRLLFDTDAEYQQFISHVKTLGRQHRTYGEAYGNSRTAGRILADEDLSAAAAEGVDAASLASSVVTANAGGIIRWAMTKLNDGSTRFLSEKVRAELGHMLVSTDPATQQRAAALIAQATQQAAARQAGSQMGRGAATQMMVQPTFSGQQPPQQDQ